MINMPRADFLTAIRKCGLSSGLKFCLDAGHEASLPAASTKWLDLSGNGEDFFRGSTGSAEGNDPAINGTPGGRSSSEYLSSDGGDQLTYDTTNPTWANNLHKSTGQGGVAAWVYAPSGAWANHFRLFSTSNNSTAQVGFNIWIRSDTAAHYMSLQMFNGSAALYDNSFGSTQLGENAWNFVSLFWDNNFSAVSGEWVFVGVNSLVRNPSITAGAAFSASNASQTMRIGGLQNGNNMPNGFRIASIAVWEGVRMFSPSHLALFNLTRSKFGV